MTGPVVTATIGYPWWRSLQKKRFSVREVAIGRHELHLDVIGPENIKYSFSIGNFCWRLWPFGQIKSFTFEPHGRRLTAAHW